jgi:hypothetical protein
MTGVEPIPKPQEAFKRLLDSTVAPMLKAHGFSRSGQTFYLRHGRNWGLINFQKSIGSNARTVIFTVNMGVVSGILPMFFSDSQTSRRPSIWACAWRQRLEYLLPGHQDKWWVIDAQTSLEQLAQEFRSHISEIAVPEIEKYIDDESLRDLWLSGHVPWITDFARVRALSILLKAIGPQEPLSATLEELQRLSQGDTTLTRLAQEHIRKLERWEPK